MSLKKYLTSDSLAGYGKSLKTSLRGFCTPSECLFYAYGRTRAENISNISQSIRKLAFSESAHYSFLVGFLKKVYKMTKSILQNTYQQYQSIKEKLRDLTLSREENEAYCTLFSACEKVLQTSPIKCKADKKIKLLYLKDVVAFGVEQFDGSYDFSSGYGLEEEAIDLINQLAAE